MTGAIDFYFDFVSPYSYLAITQLPALARQHGAEIVYKPFQLLELMKVVGNRPTTVECKNKLRYAGADLGRWAAKYGVSLHRNPHQSNFDGALLLRGALVAADDGEAAAAERGVFGSPTFVVGDELSFGNDRLEFVAAALAAAKA